MSCSALVQEALIDKLGEREIEEEPGTGERVCVWGGGGGIEEREIVIEG